MNKEEIEKAVDKLVDSIFEISKTSEMLIKQRVDEIIENAIEVKPVNKTINDYIKEKQTKINYMKVHCRRVDGMFVNPIEASKFDCLVDDLQKLNEIKKIIFNKQCEIENQGYVKGLGYVAVTNEMQDKIDLLGKIIGKE